MPETQSLPTRVLYATSARIGGSGLDAVARESVLAAWRAGILGRAIGYENRQREVPQPFIRTLRWHPVRLLGGIDRKHYYGAKKHYVDWIAARELARGGYDFLHGWSGDCVRTLRVAKRLGVPSVIEVPTWHRHKFFNAPEKTNEERAMGAAPWLQRQRNRLLVHRQQVVEEYALADLILVLSERARETFLFQGVAPEKLFKMSRGVDVNRFTPAEKPPDIFRAVFVGALIRRKGVHLLLEAWHRLALKNAELVLVGSVHSEIEPFLEKFASSGVRVAGFVPKPEELYRNASVHIFPTSLEGSAKATYEAAACGLPQITTRESGDIVIDGVNGLLIPPDNLDALCAAIETLYRDAGLRGRFGAAGRKLVVENYTWEHVHRRVLDAYRTAIRLQNETPLASGTGKSAMMRKN